MSTFPQQPWGQPPPAQKRPPPCSTLPGPPLLRALFRPRIPCLLTTDAHQWFLVFWPQYWVRRKVKMLLQFVLYHLLYFNLTLTLGQCVLTGSSQRSPETLSRPPCTGVAFRVDRMPAYHTQSGFASLRSECPGLGTQGRRPGWPDTGVSHCPSRCTGHTRSYARRPWGPQIGRAHV